MLKNNNLLLSKRLFVSNYITVLTNEYKDNRQKLFKLIENNHLFHKYHYDVNVYDKELSKYPEIKYCVRHQIELNKMINVGENILQNDFNIKNILRNPNDIENI